MSPAQRFRHHLSWGVALGVAESATIQVLTWFGLGLSHATWILVYVLVVVFSVLAGRSFERRLGTRPTAISAIGMLLVVILVSRLVYQTYMFVYINYVDPTWVDTVAAFWSQQLAEAGTAPAEIAQQIDRFRGEWRTVNVFTLSLVSYAIPQFVLGLLSVTVAVLRPWRRST